MPLQMACTCGNGLLVPEEYVGRQFKCPRCGKSVTVPHGFTKDRPVGKPIGSLPASTPVTKKSSGKSVLFVLLGVVALVAVAAGVWWLTRRGGGSSSEDGPEVSDLVLLPADAQTVATLRLAELYTMPATRDALERERKRAPKLEDPAARFERQTGLKPDEIDRFHIVGTDNEKRQGWVVARTLRPLDREKVLDRLTERVEKRHQGRRYYLGKNSTGQETAFHFAGPNVLVVSDEAGMVGAMTQAAKPVTEGPLKPIIALAETKKSQAIVGLNTQAGAIDPLKKQMPIKFEVLDKIQVLRLTLDVEGETAALAALAEMPDEKSARSLRGLVPVLLFGLQATLAPLKEKGGADAEAAEAIEKLLEEIKPQAKGKEVHASIKSDPATMAVVLMYLARQAGVMGQ